MSNEEANKAQRAAILRTAIERLHEALVDADEERRASIIKLISKAEHTLALLDKRLLH